jgi:hypothetical protein
MAPECGINLNALLVIGSIRWLAPIDLTLSRARSRSRRLVLRSSSFRR